jgi:hypothetical protein
MSKPIIIEEVSFGLYVWQMPDGRIVANDEGSFLNVASFKGDSVKINMLVDAVRHYGITEGKAKFLAGHRRVTDDEYQEQLQRLQWGLVPDEYDVPAIVEEQRARANFQ